MPLPCPGLVVGSRCQGPRGLLHTRRPLLPKSCAPAVAQLVSPTTSSTPIDHDFLNSAVFAGISKDLPEPNSYRRFEVLGKSVLMTRDREGTFRAFENRCMHRGAVSQPHLILSSSSPQPHHAQLILS